MTEQKTIHIISFDVPLPANYGGVIDVFQRLVYWKKLGYKIILHCYEYGRGISEELEKYCEKVYYYKRKKRILDVFSALPFIVKTRINQQMIERLKQDKFPIWIEGLHCAWLLNEADLSQRKKIVRIHNIEHHYYEGLAKHSSFIKKNHYLIEAKKLKKFESILAKATALYTIQNTDYHYYKKINNHTFYLPPLPQNFSISNLSEPNKTEDYLLFQGSLNVEENQNSAIWLIQNVFKYYPKQSKIAGKSIPRNIKNLCEKFDIEYIENPSDNEMQKLMNETKIHILYTNQSTGLKLKLINILSSNGEIIANDKMLEGSDWAAYCHIANSPNEFRNKINEILNDNSQNLVNSRKIAFQKFIFDTQKKLSSIF